MAEEILDLWQAVEQARTAGWTAEQRRRDYQTVLAGSDAGRRVLDDLMAICQGPPIGPTDLDKYSLEFRAGMQWVAHMIGLRMVQSGEVRKYGTPEEEKHGQRS